MMFYTQLFTSKRGPLAKIWLAAHWERKLTKAHVFECNLENTVKDIISPKIKIGLRTSGHLLLGVVRIYSRKAKYLLADCSDAFVKIKMSFTPGQTDLPVEELEATVKAITLMEDFSDFDAQLPDPSDIDLVDHFSLNQCQTDEITLKEEFSNNFLNFSDIDAQSHQPGLVDVSFQSLTQQTDTFGDEETGYDLLDFLINSSDRESADLIPEMPENEDTSTSNADIQDPIEVTMPSTVNVTLLPNEEEAFALEPVPVTPTTEKRKGTRKRKLVVDKAKQLTTEAIKEQIAEYSDLIGPLDMAPPTRKLMKWKESGSVGKLFAQPCSSVITPEINELFAQKIFQVKYYHVPDDTEALRQDREEVHRDMSSLNTESLSVVETTAELEITHNPVLTVLDQTFGGHHENDSEREHIENKSEFTHPEFPSEDSMFVQQSLEEQDSLTVSVHTQSILDSQDFGERRITRQAQKLLGALQATSKSNKNPSFSLKAHCEGNTRYQVSTTFFCLLVLKKQQALLLQQYAPFEDIIATPGPRFYD